MLERIGDVIPRFKTYENLFPKHEQLLYSLSSIYLDIIVFCADAKSLFQKAKKQRCKSPSRLLQYNLTKNMRVQLVYQGVVYEP